MSPFEIFAVGVALVAVAWDLATRRIPNVLTFGAALAALVVHAYIGGWNGAGMAAAGWVAGVALFFPVFALGGMGAGDVKLLGARRRVARPCRRGLGRALLGHRGRRDGSDRGRLLRISGAGIHERVEPADVLADRRPQTGAGADALDAPGAAARVCGSRFRRTHGDHMASVRSRRIDSVRRAAPSSSSLRLIVPLLLFIMIGIVDFGFMFQRTRC